jgi:hypothetical protein
VERDELKQLLEQMLNAHKKSVRVQENMLGMLARLKQRPEKQQPQETKQSDTNANTNTTSSAVRITNTPLPVSQAGTWNVNATQNGTWDVNISGQPINVKYSDVNFATINATGSGNTQIVPAVTGKRIRVIAFCIVAGGAVNVKFKSGDTTDITGTMNLVSGGGIAHAYDGGLFETAVGQPLNINLSAAQQVGGYVVYREVD